MEKGSIRELVLSRSILKHIRKNRKEVITGAAIGNDYSKLRHTEGNIVIAQGMFSLPSKLHIAEASYIKAMNNLCVSGAKPVGINVGLMLPQSIEEKWVRDTMELVNSLADRDNIQVMGGHTEVSDACIRPLVMITAVGNVSSELDFSYENIEDGCEIVMTKHTGLMGMAVITDKCREKLLERFAVSYIKNAEYTSDSMYIKREAEIAAEQGAVYMHDISCGGLYTALCQAVKRADKGFVINHHDVPIMQETIEICEYLDINPYMLEGTGSLIIITKRDLGKPLAEVLNSEGIEAKVIGRITDNRDRSVFNSDDEKLRYLFAPSGDEIYKVCETV